MADANTKLGNLLGGVGGISGFIIGMNHSGNNVITGLITAAILGSACLYAGNLITKLLIIIIAFIYIIGLIYLRQKVVPPIISGFIEAVSNSENDDASQGIYSPEPIATYEKTPKPEVINEAIDTSPIFEKKDANGATIHNNSKQIIDRGNYTSENTFRGFKGSGLSNFKAGSKNYSFGIKVDMVINNLPAATAGLTIGDILIKVDDYYISDLESFSFYLSKREDKKINVQFLRDKKILDTSINPLKKRE